MRDWQRTIVARITALGQGAVGIVRLSGADAYSIADRFVTAGRYLSIAAVPPRFMANAVVKADGEVWDRCLVVRFEAPRSFTGEDIVELHLHGNPLILDRVVDLSVAHGAALASPGEFTMRAVMNGKLDLIQAEAIGETIAAEATAVVRIAQRQLDGELSRSFLELRAKVVDAIARLELELDFVEEGYSFVDEDDVSELVRELKTVCTELLRNFRTGSRFRSGPRVVLLGRPNAGKSSFFNSQLGYARALVSSTPGTTRDYLEERIVHAGMVVHLVDTAGLRGAGDELEAEGVRRAWSIAGEMDLILFLVDASDADAMTGAASEIERLKSSYPDVAVEAVYTKADLILDRPPGISCSTNDPASTREILDLVVARCSGVFDGTHALVSDRQARLLAEMLALLETIAVYDQTELVSADLRRLLQPLSALVGDVGNEDVLDAVFGNFCIGK